MRCRYNQPVIARTMRVAACLVAAVLAATAAAAERARSPADATVFIRLVGSVHLEIEEGISRRSVDLNHVEIGTGSGFVVSPHGYVITNEHVVSSEQFLVTKGAQRVQVTLSVSAVQVCFRPETVATRGLAAACASATVVATDPALDLAVLFISGSDLPYIALGDSDALAPGVAVDALGYPLGRDTEVGKEAIVADFVPDVSTTPGAVSALRADDAGERRYLQISNTLNPGNSGGPVITQDGFAVGVARMRLRNAAGIGFAIPINHVKDFLESRGVDQSLPVKRLRLGGFHNLDTKGIGLRLPESLADVSRYRSRVETDGRAHEIALRIDRVRSPWTLRQLERTLLDTASFEPRRMVARVTRGALAPRPDLSIAGSATTESPEELRMEYALLDLGTEKLVARYVGPAEWMAFNESVLRASLVTLQGQAWVPRPLTVDSMEWSAPPNDVAALPMPADWLVVAASATACTGLPPTSTVSTAISPGDYTSALRATVWHTSDLEPEGAAGACSPRRGSLGPASYVIPIEWLGVSYVVEGVFTSVGPGRIAQLEVMSPTAQAAAARTLLAEWMRRAIERR